MDIGQYLQPANPITQWVVIILLTLFFIWLGVLLASVFRLWRRRGQMMRCADVRILAEALQARFGRTESSLADETALLPSSGEANSAFDDFCRVQNIKEDSIVARHMRAIFDAGWMESQLDIGTLIKYTADELFRINGWLRSVLATFIIVGLLGTLFGLADSLSQLAPLTPGNSLESSAALSQGLSHLLSQLKSAFAPSILGISLTILGVLLFSLYLQLIASGVKNTLERLTLTVWVPQLFPTTSQRWLDKLQLSEKQVQKSLEAAKQVAEFAQEIQQDVGGLKQNIKSANETLALLTESSGRINNFSDKFIEGVNRLTPFQQELRALYEQMFAGSTAFQNNLQKSVKSSEEFQQRSQTILDNQNAQLQAILNSLHLYEKAYIEERQQIDAKMQEVLDAARKAYDELGNRNQEIVASLGNPLRAELGKSLGELETTLRVQLENLLNKFATFDTPINDAARKIENSLEAHVTRTETLTGTLQREFVKRDEANQEQIKKLEDLSTQIATLLAQLAQASQFQGEQAHTLSLTMTTLAQACVSLGQGLGSLNQNMSDSRPAPGYTAEATGENARQHDSMLRQLFANSQKQGQQVQDLMSDVKDLKGEIKSSGARSQPDSKRPPAVSTTDEFKRRAESSTEKPQLHRDPQEREQTQTTDDRREATRIFSYGGEPEPEENGGRIKKLFTRLRRKFSRR